MRNHISCLLKRCIAFHSTITTFPPKSEIKYRLLFVQDSITLSVHSSVINSRRPRTRFHVNVVINFFFFVGPKQHVEEGRTKAREMNRQTERRMKPIKNSQGRVRMGNKVKLVITIESRNTGKWS